MGSGTEKGLSGLNVITFETRHAKTMCDLISVQGGNAISAPSMQEVPVQNNAHVFEFGRKLLDGEWDILILLTGVGARTLVSVLETSFPREEILDALRRVTILPRGPKPIRVLKEWNVPYALTVPEPNTWRELILEMDKQGVEVKSKRVAVQEYGVSHPEFLEELQRRGAQLTRIPVYKWMLPDDVGPMQRAVQLVAAAQADILMFTTAVQIDHMMKVARQMNLASEFVAGTQNALVASVGPDCSEALRSQGLSVDVEPASPKMGPLVAETARQARALLERKRALVSCASEVRSAILDLTSEDNALRDSLIMKACRREATPYTPVWLMRQAGRFMKDYRAIRDKKEFLAICKDKDLVTEITVMACRKLEVDAAIIFSDILVVLDAMDLGLEYAKGDGPQIHKKIASLNDVEKLPVFPVQESLDYVLQAITQTRRALPKYVPLIGFAGAPFTLASYILEGGSSKTFEKTRSFMRASGPGWSLLMQKLAQVTADYLAAQFQAGASLVQLFDSWAGCLTKDEYEQYVEPYSAFVMNALKGKGPVIHFGTKTEPFLESFARAGGDVIGVDHRIALNEAWRRIGPDRSIQGNLDPEVLHGPMDRIRERVQTVLTHADKRPGHIFNLGHGVLPDTPEENVVALVRMVKEMSRVRS